MKQVLLIKTVILLCASFIGAVASAKPASIPYYGDQFYNDVNSGASNESLSISIKRVLRSYHVPVAGANDQIVSSCQGAAKCYSHVSIGYDRAREFLLGDFYLIRKNGEYAVRDVYCQKIYGPEEFRSQKPGPGRIPSASVVNAEHTWPQSRFNGRMNKEIQKSDLHHLFPSDSKINSVRSSFEFGEVEQDRMPLKCQGPRFGTAQGRELIFEPPQKHQGNVARALFYFATRYDLNISENEEKFLRKWHKEDPVDAEERERQEEIFKLQGDRNPFIDFPELVDRIANF